jgi:DNA replicative helicase MCM subunit Mcm2 (Cdc46/Mcm family)
MDPKYKPLQKQADALRYRMQDIVNKNAHHLGRQLVQVARDVMEDIECSKAPRAVESRIEQLKRLLGHFRANPSAVISPEAAQAMYDAYENLRRQLRALPNY